MNTKLIKERRRLVEIISKTNELLGEFLDTLLLMLDESEMRDYCKKYEESMKKTTRIHFNPEVMSDPENLEYLQKKKKESADKYAKFKYKLQVIDEFKSLVINHELDCDFDVWSHPNYFTVLGDRFYASLDGETTSVKSFEHYEKELQNELESFIINIEKTITAVFEQFYEIIRKPKKDVAPTVSCAGCGRLCRKSISDESILKLAHALGMTTDEVRRKLENGEIKVI